MWTDGLWASNPLLSRGSCYLHQQKKTMDQEICWCDTHICKWSFAEGPHRNRTSVVSVLTQFVPARTRVTFLEVGLSQAVCLFVCGLVNNSQAPCWVCKRIQTGSQHTSECCWCPHQLRVFKGASSCPGGAVNGIPQQEGGPTSWADFPQTSGLFVLQMMMCCIFILTVKL